MTPERPIACSLTADEMPVRLAEMAALGRDALDSVDTNGRRAVLRFRSGANTRERLAAIVAAESHCCAFPLCSVGSTSDRLEQPPGRLRAQRQPMKVLLMLLMADLPEDLELYFFPDPAAVLIPLNKLRPTKSPESQPDSVDRAEDLMRLAGGGETARRGPISVARHGGGYTILDGNATYGVALRHHWAALPAIVTE